MGCKTFYILHKNGANSHYLALEYLLEQHGYTLKHREFSIISKLFKGLVKGKLGLVKKQLINSLFFLKLLLTKGQRVVLGIAPYDRKLKGLSVLLRNHKVYYHTSWTCWDGTFQPKAYKSETARAIWDTFFTERVAHIFAVTDIAKQSLLSNFNVVPSKISVVAHALDSAFENNKKNQKTPNSFLYYGRLLPEKGIAELLTYFKHSPSARLTIIGQGKLVDMVQEVANQSATITYIPYLENKCLLAEEVAKHQFLILNAKKTKKWEELFGLVLIEAMSQSCIPIAASHSGPSEIINPNFGFLFEEGALTSQLDAIIDNDGLIDQMSKDALEASKEYHIDKIAKRWSAILS